MDTTNSQCQQPMPMPMPTVNATSYVTVDGISMSFAPIDSSLKTE